MIDNGFSKLPVHVSGSLLTNVESLIGPYRMAFYYPFEMFLQYALLKSGYDVSERAYVLNKNSHVNDIDYCPYIPFGRPSEGVSTRRPREFDCSFGPENYSRH